VYKQANANSAAASADVAAILKSLQAEQEALKLKLLEQEKKYQQLEVSQR